MAAGEPVPRGPLHCTLDGGPESCRPREVGLGDWGKTRWCLGYPWKESGPDLVHKVCDVFLTVELYRNEISQWTLINKMQLLWSEQRKDGGWAVKVLPTHPFLQFLSPPETRHFKPPQLHHASWWQRGCQSNSHSSSFKVTILSWPAVPRASRGENTALLFQAPSACVCHAVAPLLEDWRWMLRSSCCCFLFSSVHSHDGPCSDEEK